MGYTAFDQFLAWRRFQAAKPHLQKQSRVCDIGCGLEAYLLKRAAGLIGFGVGLDYQLTPEKCRGKAVALANITRPLPLKSGRFDHAVMLAVFEHLKQPEAVLREIYRILGPAGSLIMTWPNSQVDPLLHVLHKIGIVSHEMESQDHQPRKTVPEIEAMLRQIGFVQFKHRRFQFGLNNLLVAYKTPVRKGS